MKPANPRCDDVIARLIAALRQGGDVSAEDREHVANCEDCQGVLAAAARLEDELGADARGGGTEERLSHVAQQAEAAARRAEHRRRTAFIVLGALAVLIPRLMAPRVVIIQILGALIALGAVGTLVLQRMNAGTQGAKLYKRLKGQWMFGVCRGLAETAGLPVAVIRAGFVALLIIGKMGVAIALSLYLLLDMSLEVHPEDRGLLLRFRLKRWLDRRSSGLASRVRRRRHAAP